MLYSFDHNINYNSCAKFTSCWCLRPMLVVKPFACVTTLYMGNLSVAIQTNWLTIAPTFWNISRQSNGLWFFVFLGGLGGALYYLYSILHNYFQYQPITQVEFVQEFPTIFPAVTFCSLNPFLNLVPIITWIN